MSWCSRCAEFHTGLCPKDAAQFEEKSIVVAPENILTETTWSQTACLQCAEKDMRIKELEGQVQTVVKRRQWNKEYQRRRRSEAKQGAEDRAKQEAV